MHDFLMEHPRRVVVWLAAGVLLAASLGIGYGFVTRNLAPLYWVFDQLAVPVLILTPALEFMLASHARTYFAPGQTLRRAWGYLAVAALLRYVGYMLAHLLGRKTAFFSPDLPPAVANELVNWGTVLAGPVAFVLTAYGLGLFLYAMQRQRVRPSIRWVDYTLVVLMVLTSIRHFWEVGAYLSMNGAPTVPMMLLWLSDPLMTLLLAQALWLRRAAQQLGHGLLAGCWAGLAASAFLQALGNVQLWLERTVTVPEGWILLGHVTWLLAALASAYAPACQIEASRRAHTA